MLTDVSDEHPYRKFVPILDTLVKTSRFTLVTLEHWYIKRLGIEVSRPKDGGNVTVPLSDEHPYRKLFPILDT